MTTVPSDSGLHRHNLELGRKAERKLNALWKSFQEDMDQLEGIERSHYGGYVGGNLHNIGEDFWRQIEVGGC